MSPIKHLGPAMLLAAFFWTPAHAQQNHPVPIKAYPLEITYDKTTHLLFPYAIRSVDRGSGAVMARRPEGVENILELKAAQKQFPETNLSVLTDDGHFYVFRVSYADSPRVLTLSFAKDQAPVSFQGQPITRAAFDSVADRIHTKRGFLHRGAWRGRTLVFLKGLYQANGILYLELGIKNFSALDYQPGPVRFLIRDRSGAKWTASQERPLKPIYSEVSPRLRYGQSGFCVYAFRAFAPAPSQEMIIRVTSGDMDRTTSFRIPSRVFERTQKLTH